MQAKLMMLIAKFPPQISELLPGQAMVQLVEGTFALTESPHMHCLPFSTPASLLWRLKHCCMHISCDMSLCVSTGSPMIRACLVPSR